MLIAAALIELELMEADSLKARRRVANAVKDRVSQRFGVSIAEIADPEDRRSVCLGCVKVGIDPRHLRSGMEKVIRFVEGLGLAELVGEDITVLRLDELPEVELGAEHLPSSWSKE